MYALEQYSGIQRCILCDDFAGCGHHAMTVNVTSGTEKGGELIVKYTKPYSSSVSICFIPVRLLLQLIGCNCCCFNVPCCCCPPKLTAVTSTKQKLGTSKYICDMCFMVPKFGYYEEDQMIYYVAPETVCSGACPVEGVHSPFLFRDPTTKVPLPERPKEKTRLESALGDKASEECPGIQKMGKGRSSPCNVRHNPVAVQFPLGITPERKAGLLGMAFLIDAVLFEINSSEQKQHGESSDISMGGPP